MSKKVDLETVIERNIVLVGHPAAELIIKTQDEWDALNNQYSPFRKLADVDFDQYSVVGVLMGTVAPGHGIHIDRIEKDGDDRHVYVTKYNPKPGEVTIAMDVAPGHIVKIEKFDGTAKFSYTTAKD